MRFAQQGLQGGRPAPTEVLAFIHNEDIGGRERNATALTGLPEP